MKIKELVVSGNLSFYICIISIALLSLNIHWLPPFMVLWLFAWYFEKKEDLSWNLIKGKESTNLFFLFAVLFTWQMIGLFFADTAYAGFERIIKRIAFILFPAVLFLPGQKIKNNIRFILKLFSFFILIYIIYCLVNALFNSFHYEEGKWVFRTYHELYTYESYFMGERLSGGVHPTYLAMYVMTAMIISLDVFFESKLTQAKKIVWFLIAFIFFIFILLLSSRAGVMIVMIILPLFLISRLVSKIPSWLMISILIAFFAVFTALFFINTRLKNTLEEISNENISETLSNDIRVMIWRSAWGAINGNLLTGVGTGDASNELKKEFINRGYREGFYNDLNAHNQFLEILLENGLVGLILFLGIFAYMTKIALAQKNSLLLFFIIMVIIFFLFESMLNRLWGIMFFPLMTFLLVNKRSESA